MCTASSTASSTSSRRAAGLVLSQITGDFDPESAARAVELYKGGGVTLRPRTKAEVTRFFDGRELTAPGVGLAAAWHPELGEPAARGRRDHSGVLGRGAQSVRRRAEWPAAQSSGVPHVPVAPGLARRTPFASGPSPRGWRYETNSSSP